MAQGTVAGLTIASEINGNKLQMESLIEKAVAAVRKERDEALIQFQPNIAEARDLIYQEFELEDRNMESPKRSIS